MELVGTSGTPIVSMVVFDDRLFVATTDGVFERLSDGKFHELQFFYIAPPVEGKS